MSNIFIRIVIVDVMKSFKDKLACMLYHEYMLCFTCHWRECFIILTLLSLSHYRPHSHAILAGARNQSADLDSGPTGTAYKEKFAQDQKLRKERNKSRESVSESHSKRTPSDEDDHDENGMYINIDVRSIPCTCIYCHCSRVLNELTVPRPDPRNVDTSLNFVDPIDFATHCTCVYATAAVHVCGTHNYFNICTYPYI